MKAKVWYLYHSGFAVKTAAHFLIFDYWQQRPRGKGLESGVIDPAALTDDNVIVFASHAHGDQLENGADVWEYHERMFSAAAKERVNIEDAEAVARHAHGLFDTDDLLMRNHEGGAYC